MYCSDIIFDTNGGEFIWLFFLIFLVYQTFTAKLDKDGTNEYSGSRKSIGNILVIVLIILIAMPVIVCG